MSKPKVTVFASGGKGEREGGSVFHQLIKDTRSNRYGFTALNADIDLVVSQHLCGGVHNIALEEGVRFLHAPGPYGSKEYQKIVEENKPDIVVSAGWTKMIKGIFDKVLVVNTHPASLPRFGGKGMVGIKVHEAVINSGVPESALSIHFITDSKEYDTGNIIFTRSLSVRVGETAESLQERIKMLERWYYGQVINQVLQGRTSVATFDMKPLPKEILWEM